MKAYAVQLLADETTTLKVVDLKKVMEETGAVGINPDYPFAYVLWRTPKQAVEGFKRLEKVFSHCKLVKNVAEIP